MQKMIGTIIIASLAITGCAKRDYNIRKANAQNAVPLYSTPATVGGGIQNTMPVMSNPLPSVAMAPVASNMPTYQSNMPNASYETTSAIPAMAMINRQETRYQPPVTNYQQPAYNTSSAGSYRVGMGDTIFSISRRFNVHPNDLLAHNPLANPNSLAVGQVINIPQTANQYPRTSSAQGLAEGTENTTKPTASFASLETHKTETAPANLMGEPVGNKANNDLLAAVRQSRGNTPSMTTAEAGTRTGGKYFYLPERAKIIQRYDAKNSNKGVRIAMPNGSQIKNSVAGTVVYVGNIDGYGKTILLRHPNGFISNYAGLNKIMVKQGQEISANTTLATVETGSGSMAEMMYELRQGTTPINPESYIG